MLCSLLSFYILFVRDNSEKPLLALDQCCKFANIFFCNIKDIQEITRNWIWNNSPALGLPLFLLMSNWVVSKGNQFSSVAQSCLTLCHTMDHSTPGLPVHHQLTESTQTHVHWVGDAIQPSHPLSSPYPPAFNLSQHQGLSQWVSSSHQVAKVFEFQLQHKYFQGIFRTDLL